eukprot:16450390-Heterocapsa_arctica.AAC.1
MGIFDEVVTAEEEGRPITSVYDASGLLKIPRQLLVDPGAFTHTCPNYEYPDVPLKQELWLPAEDR